MTMRVRHLRAAGLSWILTAAWAGAQTLAVVPTPGRPTSGGILSVDIQLNSQGTEQPAALEWTLGFPVLELVTATAGPAAAAAEKPLQCSGQDAMLRCALVGMNANSIPDGVIATVQLRAISLFPALAPVMLSNVGAASPAADRLLFQGEGTAITLVAFPGPPSGLLSSGTIAHIVAGGTWKTTIALVNIGSVSAVAELNFFDNSGQPLPLPLRYLGYPAVSAQLRGATLAQMVEAGSMVVLETSTAIASEMVEGSALLASAGSIRGFVVFTHTGTHQEAAVPMETGGSRKILAFDNTAGRHTGVALANAGAPVSVNAVIRDDQGRVLGNPLAIDLPAGGHTSFMLESVYRATAGLRGTIDFQSSGIDIAVIGLRANGNAITTFPVLNTSGDFTSNITHVTAGAGWTTSFTLVNIAPVSINTALTFHTQQGTPLPLNLVYPQTGATRSGVSTTAETLPAGATLDMETRLTPSPLENETGQSAPSAVGSATLTGGVSGFAIFRFDASGQEAVIPLETRGASSYWLAYDNTGGLATGFAIANATGVDGYAHLTFRDESGAPLGTSDFSLAPNGQASFVMADRFGITAGRRGTIEAAPPPGGKISMIGLRATPDGKFTTLPVMEKWN